MLKSLAIVAVAALSAVGAAQGVVALDARLGAPARAAEAAPAPASAAPPAGAAAITKSPDGHFWAEAAVNGRRVRFLVDTGATTVALTAADARRLGVRVSDADFVHPVTTAAGQAQAALVELDYVSVAGARVDQVQALVLREGLQTSLLGMSYLGRLSRIEATRHSLVLRP